MGLWNVELEQVVEIVSILSQSLVDAMMWRSSECQDCMPFYRRSEKSYCKKLVSRKERSIAAEWNRDSLVHHLLLTEARVPTHAHVLRKVPQDSQRGYWIRYTFLIKENPTGRSLWAFWGQGELPRTDQHAQKSKAIQILPSFFVGSPPGDPLAPSWCSLRRRRCCCGTPRPEHGGYSGALARIHDSDPGLA